MQKSNYLLSARSGGFLLVCLILSACATIRPVIHVGSAHENWQTRQRQLNQLENWELKGRIGFLSERESGSASLYWKQEGDAYELKIIAPLGMGSLIVVGNKNGVVLQSSDGEIVYAEDAQKLVWQKTGWVIPMANLRRWMLGLALEEDYSLDNSGRLHHIENKPWRVEYQSYQMVDKYELPRKMQIASADLKIKLLIKDWQLF